MAVRGMFKIFSEFQNRKMFQVALQSLSDIVRFLKVRRPSAQGDFWARDNHEVIIWK